MVARKVETTTVDTESLVELFVVVESFDSTEDNSTDLNDIVNELGEDAKTVYDKLCKLEEAELLDSKGRFLNSTWWIAVPDVSADNAEAIAREALSNFVPEPEEKPKRTRRTKAQIAADEAAKHAKNAYAVARDEETFALSMGATPEEAATARKATEAELMDTDTNEGVTGPESAPEPPAEDTATGLTRAEIKAELPSVKLETPVVPKGEPFNWERVIKALKDAHAVASNNPDGYIAPEEVTNLPARPEGVNENTWDMVFNAYSTNEKSTLAARIWWIERAQSQAD